VDHVDAHQRIGSLNRPLLRHRIKPQWGSRFGASAAVRCVAILASARGSGSVGCHKEWAAFSQSRRHAPRSRWLLQVPVPEAAIGASTLQGSARGCERREHDTGVDQVLWTSRKSASGSMAHDDSSSSNALASFRSSVSNPSVNQPYTGARRSRASSRLP
jgi:hypothetical protein